MRASDLIHGLGERGYKGSIVPVHRLFDLQREVARCYEEGLLDEEFYQESLRSILFAPPDGLQEARSLVVVAVPRPHIRIVFLWGGNSFPVLVPAYYLFWRQAERRLEEVLQQLASPSGHRFVRVAPPAKLLAACSGLGSYGRNNICYVPGMGSFLRLWVFCFDIVCRDDPWRNANLLEACRKCSLCMRHCPTSAITTERFLLRAERCITFHNERSVEIPFPSWIEPSWHNSLIGCSLCQTVCPINTKFIPWVEDGDEFSEDETALLLQGNPAEDLPPVTLQKLVRLDLADYADLLPRNLRVLLERGELPDGARATKPSGAASSPESAP